MVIHGDFGPVAILEGQVSTRDVESDKPRFRGRAYDFRHLWWTHTGALLLLQGVSVHLLVGPIVTIIRGQHTKTWAPRPAIHDVRFVVLLDNPEGLSSIDIFRVTTGLGL